MILIYKNWKYNYPQIRQSLTMDVSDDMTEIHRKVEYELDALSAELDEIDDLSNIDQL